MTNNSSKCMRKHIKIKTNGIGLLPEAGRFEVTAVCGHTFKRVHVMTVLKHKYGDFAEEHMKKLVAHIEGTMCSKADGLKFKATLLE